MAQATTTLKVVSFVRRYHAYLDVWEPKIGEKRQLMRKLFNKEDQRGCQCCGDGAREGQRKRTLKQHSGGHCSPKPGHK